MFNLNDFRKLFEMEPKGEEVSVEGLIKRVSNYEGKKLLRLSDESNEEILILTEEDVKQNQRVAFKGKLKRLEGKLCLFEAKKVENAQKTVKEVKQKYDKPIKDDKTYRLYGRLVSLRPMGKAIFGHIQDVTAKVQIYLKRDNLGEIFETFKREVSLGDIIEVEGKPFRTKTGELTLEVFSFKVLQRCRRPLPEKWHGLKDPNLRYKQRYLDLIANQKSREVFLLRSILLRKLREFFYREGFFEVETPILQPVASGANAKPFKTYHNYLQRELYLRIAPELYLKRLIVGGFNRVFEVGKNFRNEGVDSSHNPEFTMVEFYVAYWDYTDLIEFTQRLMEYLIKELSLPKTVSVKGKRINLAPPYRKVRYFELLEKKSGRGKDFFLKDYEGLKKLARELEVKNYESISHPKLIDKVFEKLCGDELLEPTFVLDFPKVLSPLAKGHKEDKDLVERFELFIGGFEVANAYTELDDPNEQRERFLEQLKRREMGDEESMEMDEDFIRALEYGMPPTAGEGIGIDRLVMILSESESIKDVILFPTY